MSKEELAMIDLEKIQIWEYNLLRRIKQSIEMIKRMGLSGANQGGRKYFDLVESYKDIGIYRYILEKNVVESKVCFYLSGTVQKLLIAQMAPVVLVVPSHVVVTVSPNAFGGAS